MTHIWHQNWRGMKGLGRWQPALKINIGKQNNIAWYEWDRAKLSDDRNIDDLSRCSSSWFNWSIGTFTSLFHRAVFSSWTAAGEWIYKRLPLDENLTILPPRFQPIWTQPLEVARCSMLCKKILDLQTIALGRKSPFKLYFNGSEMNRGLAVH